MIHLTDKKAFILFLVVLTGISCLGLIRSRYKIILRSQSFEQRSRLLAQSQKSGDNVLFWGNRRFDADQHLNKVRDALLANNEEEVYKQCLVVMSAENPRPVQLWSQAYQEWTIWHNLFLGKTHGIYIDVGAHRPFDLSNTAFFDRCMGWSGLCVEPTNSSNLFKHTRSCNMALHCGWSSTKTLSLEVSGMPRIVSDQELRQRGDRLKLFQCPAMSSHDLLQNYKARNGQGQEIDLSKTSTDSRLTRSDDGRIEIDLISVDIEGAEIEFLKCFPFDAYDVKVWTVEINKGSQVEQMIDKILLANGFMKWQYMDYWGRSLDAVYVKNPHPIRTTDVQKKKEWSAVQRCGDPEILP